MVIYGVLVAIAYPRIWMHLSIRRSYPDTNQNGSIFSTYRSARPHFPQQLETADWRPRRDSHRLDGEASSWLFFCHIWGSETTAGRRRPEYHASQGDHKLHASMLRRFLFQLSSLLLHVDQQVTSNGRE